VAEYKINVAFLYNTNEQAKKERRKKLKTQEDGKISHINGLAELLL
jgi:hypothetical protein